LTTQAAPDGGRRGLFQNIAGGVRPSRAELVALARSGLRGLLVTGFLDLDVDGPAVITGHLDFLREAAGVGLRILWRGDLRALPVRHLSHLDPPRGISGFSAWPTPQRQMFTLRCGPGFVLVNDMRGGSLDRFCVSDPDEVRMLADPSRSCVASSELNQSESSAVARLAARDMFAAIGDMWLALPVRFRYARH
jgi:Family of unknown function (DUF5825)